MLILFQLISTNCHFSAKSHYLTQKCDFSEKRQLLELIKRKEPETRSLLSPWLSKRPSQS